MAGEASRWVSYDKAADLLGMPLEAVRRLALRRGWQPPSTPAGGAMVVVPEALAGDPTGDPGEVDLDRIGARSVVDFLKAHVDRLTEALP